MLTEVLTILANMGTPAAFAVGALSAMFAVPAVVYIATRAVTRSAKIAELERRLSMTEHQVTRLEPPRDR